MLRAERVKYTKEEVARRGRDLYQKKIRPKLRREKKGRVVAVDIRTADFEVADDALSAANHLRERQPEAEIWFERVGYRAFQRMGPQRQTQPNSWRSASVPHFVLGLFKFFDEFVFGSTAFEKLLIDGATD